MTICHRTRATTNPYVLITVSVNSVIGSGGGNGHSNHNTTSTNLVNPTTNGITPGSGPFDTSWTYASNRKWWGDIIPPFTYSSGSYAGLNWGPSTGTTWAWPNPTTTSATDWLQASEFATAVSAAPSSTYKTAVEQCMDLGASGAQSVKSAAMDTPQEYFNVSVNEGEDPTSVQSDLSDQSPDPAYSTADLVLSTLETAQAAAAPVQTDAASGTTTTTSNLNGTLKTGSTWTSWRFEWGLSAASVRDGSGSTYTYTPGTDPSSSIGAGPRSPTYAMTGLTCGTTYYFRVVGVDNAAPAVTSYGAFNSFSTSSCGGSGGGSSGGSSSGGGSTSTTSTSTTSTSATTSPGVGAVKKPETEKVKPGKDITLVDGEPAKTETKKDGKSTKVEISGPEFEVEVGGTTPAGAPLPLTPGGAPIVAPKEKVATSGKGYAPGTSIEVYLLDPLTSLGSFPVNPDGTFSGSVTLPPTLPPGEYVIQMNGYTPTSQVRSVSVGISVRSAALVLCSEGTTAKSSAACPSKPQRPRKGFILPDELLGGRNLLIPTRVRMNSGVFADVQALCTPVLRSAPKGDIAYCATTREGKKTYVLIRPDMRLSAQVVISAPATEKYAAYKFTKRYKVN